MPSLFTLIERPYNLLLRDVVRIFKLLQTKQRIAILALSGLMLLQAVMELLTITGIRQLGMATTDPQSISSEYPWRALFAIMPDFAAWAAGSSVRYLLLAACFVTLLIGLKNAVIWLVMRGTAQVSEGISLEVAAEIMHRFLYGEYRWHLSSESGAALQMLLWRNNLANLLVQQLSALTGFLSCGVLFIGLVVQEPTLSLITVGVLGGMGGALYAGLRKHIDRCAATSAAVNRSENATFIAATRGIRDVLIYGQQEAFLKSLSGILEQGVRPRVFLSIANSLPTVILEILGFTLVPLTILLMNQWGATKESIISAVMLLVLTAWRVLPYLNRGVGQMMAIRGLRPMAIPVLDFLQTLRNCPLIVQPASTKKISFTSRLELVDADFTYPGDSSPTLQDVSISIPKGALVGIVGSSGAGKSTICNLLSGLCAPGKGQLLVDGQALSPQDMASFRHGISFVPQAPFLMAGSLAANVAFSQWGKPWDEEKVITACKQAALDFVPLDAKGILYPIGENGTGLSGGQAQRVAIARALYAQPEIIIFDEATSALDVGNENIIVSSISRLRGSVTCVIIAHRLSTVEHCDLIYWLENGRVVAQGSPQVILPRYTASFKQTEGQ